MVIFDANMILRYILDDDKEMADKAEQYVRAGDAWVTLEVIAEVVYVLRGFYSRERKEIADIITKFLTLVDCKECDVLLLALRTYGTKNLDFVDCVLYGYHKLRGAEIATFDKKLLRLMEHR